jgi:hypothetical protein
LQNAFSLKHRAADKVPVVDVVSEQRQLVCGALSGIEGVGAILPVSYCVCWLGLSINDPVHRLHGIEEPKVHRRRVIRAMGTSMVGHRYGTMPNEACLTDRNIAVGWFYW